MRPTHQCFHEQKIKIVLLNTKPLVQEAFISTPVAYIDNDLATNSPKVATKPCLSG